MGQKKIFCIYKAYILYIIYKVESIYKDALFLEVVSGTTCVYEQVEAHMRSSMYVPVESLIHDKTFFSTHLKTTFSFFFLDLETLSHLLFLLIYHFSWWGPSLWCHQQTLGCKSSYTQACLINVWISVLLDTWISWPKSTLIVPFFNVQALQILNVFSSSV